MCSVLHITVTNHSFHYSQFRVSRIFILNVQNGKSNVQAYPNLHCLHTSKCPFLRHTIVYAGFEGRPKQAYTVETLKQH